MLAYILDILEVKCILLVFMSPPRFEVTTPSSSAVQLHITKCYHAFIFKVIHSRE